MLTFNHLIADARRKLRDAGIDAGEAALDARLLAQHVLDWNQSTLISRGAEPIMGDVLARFETLVDRRARREPLAYIVGVKEFWSLPFEVSPAVLIPRPETELLVETALEAVPESDSRFRVADACTGSGCVAVAVAMERPLARVTATDISREALAVAGRNATRHGARNRIELLCCDVLSDTRGTFDLILSNPPYVPNGDRPGLQPEVRGFEPPEALFAGQEGLDVIARLVQQSAKRLRAGGHLMFELGAGQEPAIVQLISQFETLTIVSIKRDLRDIPRVVIVQQGRSPEPA